MSAPAPLLVFGWGNPSRGDDALGPLFIERLRAAMDPAMQGDVDLLTDYQLQVEHALDMVGREHVLFVDAAVTCASPFEVTSLVALRDASFTTHTMSPASLMEVFRDVQGADAPPCTQLSIQGERFALGEELSAAGRANLDQAVSWGVSWLESCRAS